MSRMVPAALVLGLLMAVAPNVVGAQEPPTPTPPADYVALKDTLSQPIYPQIKTESAKFTTFDGEQIYVEITRPNPDTYPELKVPVILEASPYHGTIATRIGDRIFPGPKNGNQNLGLTGYFAPRGYAVAMMDLRGTGRSTGCLDHLGPNDAKDMKLVIEWLASQPWSNGRVGMTGHSYVGSTPSIAAAQRPKGLVTIAPSAGLASMYDHQFNKGVPWLLQWVGPMIAYEWLALYRDLPPGVPPPPVLGGGASGDNFSANGPNPEIGCGMQHSALTAGSGQVTGQYELWHAQRDWRALAADVDIPIFMIHGVNDNAARIPAAEWFFANRFNRPGDKIWLGQHDHGSGGSASSPGPTRCQPARTVSTGHVNCRFDQWTYALHAWFDRHLMQRDVDTGPPVEVFLNSETPLPVQTNGNYNPFDNPGKVYTAGEWTRPPVRTELYPDLTDTSLGADGALRFSPPAQTGSKVFGTTAEAVLNLPVQRGRLTFVGEPVQEDTLFLGLPRMQLNASVSTGEIIHLVVTLFREDEEGNREAMNFCAIQPQLRHGIHTISPVIPGQEMELPLQCFSMAHWVPAGQHLELEVSTGSQHHAAFGSDRNITVFTGPNRTHYLLPQVPEFTLFDDVPLKEAA